MQKNKVAYLILMLLALVFTTSCYHRRYSAPPSPSAEADTMTTEQADSMQFYQSHHYERNYNFIVSADSLVLYIQQPEEIAGGMMVDSFSVPRRQHIAVADIRVMHGTEKDSIWVELATTTSQFGWILESHLLKQATPSDPISQFIAAFSDTHTLIFLTIAILVVVAFIIRKLLRKDAKIVHFNDIDSIYPTLLALLVASSAALYASIQMLAPDTWQEFYFHPSLNPFSEPPILCLFISAVWLMLIILGAAIDDTFNQLTGADALLYLCGLAAVCAIDYIVFSILTLHYIGYPLLLAYWCFAFWRFHKRPRRLRCGKCGALLPIGSNRCPRCGAIND